ncbi:hypothetical protein TWF281_011320 [Arthrobotrys megalospora]
MIAQPPGRRDKGEYYYERREGRSNYTFIYVLEPNFFLNHRAFRHNPVTEIIFGDDTQSTFDISEDSPHGTAVVSKIIGWTTGTARYANVIAVKLSNSTGSTGWRQIDSAVTKILADMDSKVQGAQSKGDKIMPRFIVNLSWKFPAPANPLAFDQAYITLDQTMLRFEGRDDVLLVIASPNDGGQPQKYWPHDLFWGRRPNFPNVIFVGGVDKSGQHAFPQSVLTDVSAPARNVRIANATLVKDESKVITDIKDGGISLLSGNSFATPAISGILATFLADDELSPLEAKKRLQDLAHSHGTGFMALLNPPVAWNGQTSPVPQISSSTTSTGPAAPLATAIIYVCGGATPTSNVEPTKRLERRTNARRAIRITTISSVVITASVKVSKTVSFTITRCESSVNITPTATPTFTQIPYIYSYNDTLCKLCKDANGEVPIDGVIYIPADCPCK